MLAAEESTQVRFIFGQWSTKIWKRREAFERFVQIGKIAFGYLITPLFNRVRGN